MSGQRWPPSRPARMKCRNRRIRCQLARRTGQGLVRPPVLVRAMDAVLVLHPHEVVVGIERVVAFRPVADLEVSCGSAAPIDEVVRVFRPGGITGAHSGGEYLLALAGDEHDLAREHIDELVLQRVPVTKRRLAARTKRDEVDAELGEAAGVAQLALRTVSHAGTKG